MCADDSRHDREGSQVVRTARARVCVDKHAYTYVYSAHHEGCELLLELDAAFLGRLLYLLRRDEAVAALVELAEDLVDVILPPTPLRTRV